MDVSDAQREVRRVYRGGSVGQSVSGLLWLASATVATYGTPRAAIMLLVVGGVFIFPVMTLVLRLLGGPSKLSRENALNSLGLQVALVLPLCLPLVGAAAMYRLSWFYPAFMILLGAHYLPFVFLYGMPMFGVLAGLLIGLGVLLARAPSLSFAAPAWMTGVILLVFAAVGLFQVRRKERA